VEAMNLWLGGLQVALRPENVFFAFIGCVLGTWIGVLPGIGPAAGTAILIPITFGLDPVPAIMMLCAIYYGSQYGGTITSILVNVPGEASSVVTCFDGHPMAMQGRAGTALGIAAIGSFVGGTIATIGVMIVALPLAKLALKFGPPEIFALVIVGFTMIVGLTGKRLIPALLMMCFGLILALVGQDPVRGEPRFAFDVVDLYDGFDFVPVVMGLFGISEVLLNIEQPVREVIKTKLSSLIPSKEEWKAASGAIARGTTLGFFMGLVPGISSVIPTFVSYVVEKAVAKNPERFGRGAIEGVAGPETANNAYSQSAMIPLLTLGLPGSPTLAVIMGAFLINGITPGPLLFRDRPDLAWGLIASFYVGNVILLILNLPLVGLWARLLEIPYQYLYSGVLLFCFVGAYSVRQSTFDLGVAVLFGVLGYIFRKLDWPMAPIILALILGPMAEKALRTSLEMSGGDFSIFISRPISAVLLGSSLLILAGAALQDHLRRWLTRQPPTSPKAA